LPSISHIENEFAGSRRRRMKRRRRRMQSGCKHGEK
jgi:hypothetical protein